MVGAWYILRSIGWPVVVAVVVFMGGRGLYKHSSLQEESPYLSEMFPGLWQDPVWHENATPKERSWFAWWQQQSSYLFLPMEKQEALLRAYEDDQVLPEAYQIYYRFERLTLLPGQTVSSTLLRHGIAQQDVQEALAKLQPHMDFRKLRPGDNLSVKLRQDRSLVALEVERGPLEKAIVQRRDDQWFAQKMDVQVDVIVKEVAGEVRTTLWESLIAAGEDGRLAQALVDIFAYDIDFYSEVRAGDSYVMLVEKRFVDGKFVDYGEVRAAEFVIGNRLYRAFAYHSPSAPLAYYDDQGRSLRKQLLKAPLKYAPVTSRFGSRKHPILGYTRNHNGVDYGVPVGTPVWSVGDGKVVFAGQKNGFGQCVEVSHANGWTSQYAHLSRIQVRRNQKVQQKDVVGLVGQTGLSTGPHLHYGLKQYGQYMNPLQQHFAHQPPLKGSELYLFQAQAQYHLRQLNKLRMAQNLAGDPHKG